MSETDHAAPRPLANGKSRIDFQTDPSRYRHWKLNIDGNIATPVSYTHLTLPTKA